MTQIVLIAGPRAGGLGPSVARALGTAPWPVRYDLFPDGEHHVLIEAPVRNKDVFLLQPAPAPVGESLLELLLLADAARRSGAGRLFAVIPYFGYARQDRRTKEGEPIGLRVVTETLRQAHFDRVVTVDLHSAPAEGCFPCPVEHLSALPLLVEAVRPRVGADAVVVSPDLGAARLARDCGRRLGLPVSLVHKTRLSGREVAVEEVIGDAKGRMPFVIDDMISTGGTLAAALDALAGQGALPGALVAATHGLFSAGSAERLRAARVARLFVTDSVEPAEAPRVPTERISLAPLLTDAILRLHEGRSLDDLLARR